MELAKFWWKNTLTRARVPQKRKTKGCTVDDIANGHMNKQPKNQLNTCRVSHKKERFCGRCHYTSLLTNVKVPKTAHHALGLFALGDLLIPSAVLKDMRK